MARRPAPRMAITEEDRAFVDGLIDYYVGEAGSYAQLAEEYTGGEGSVGDAAFGIIAGCVYAGFMQAFQGRGAPGLEEMRELGSMIRGRAPQIREALGA